MEILDSVNACVEAAVKQAGDIEIVAIGITNQRETTLMWDRQTGRPLHNAIVWLDTRTDEICERIATEHGGQVRRRCRDGLG